MGAARIEFSAAQLAGLRTGVAATLEPCSAVSITADPMAGNKIVIDGAKCPPDQSQCPSVEICLIQRPELYARFRSALG